MTTPKWEAGHLYIPGDLVQPRQAVGGVSVAIPNAGFESGDSDWTKGTGWVITSSGAAPKYAGSFAAEFQGAASGPAVIEMAVAAACKPGQTITAKVKCNTGGNGVNDAGVAIRLTWLTAADAVIRVDEGNICRGGGSAYFESGVTATAPANAEKVKVGANAYRNDGMDALWIDNFTWNHVTPTAQEGLIYKAVQDDPGHSASSEPAWPTTLGVQVIDNEVIWEAVLATRITYEARPILKTGTTEPTWPTTPGAFVLDGTVSWECVSRAVTDENCPQSKVVAIAAGKVFAADGDIVRFCATANPLDWSAEQDAGFLPTGLQQANANDIAVLNIYRSNLVAMNPSSFQMWQADPDPALMVILDQMDGVGSSWQGAAQPVGNDLFFLPQLGVRSVGIAGASTNLQAGDVGMPIDPLVQDAMRVITANDSKAVATYYPGAGQYWLCFKDYPPPGLSIIGDLPDGPAGEVVSYEYTVVGGVRPYASADVSGGSLPAGLALDTSDLASDDIIRITGTRTVEGVYPFTLHVVDADGSEATLDDTSETTGFTISGNLVGGFVGAPTSGTYTNTNGYGDITYTVLSGTFPAGVTLDPSGTWSGNFASVGSPSWVIQGEDEAGNTATLNDTADILDNDLWVAELGHVGAEDYVYRLNGTSMAVTGPILIQDVPGEQMVVAPDFTKLLIPNFNSDSVSVISVADNSVTNIAVSADPRGIACDETYVYLTHWANKTITKRLLSDLSVVATSATMADNTDECALTPDGTKLLVLAGTGMYVLNTSDLSLVTTVNLTNNCKGLAVGSDGLRAAVVDSFTESAKTILLSDYTVTDLGFSSVSDLCWAPNAQWIYVIDEPNVKRVNPATGAWTSLLNITSGYAIECNAAGTRLFVSKTNNTVITIDLATNLITNTVSLGVYGQAIACRPLP